MSVSITHTKVSAVADGSDANQVQPSDWNASHTFTDIQQLYWDRSGTILSPHNAGDSITTTGGMNAGKFTVHSTASPTMMQFNLPGYQGQILYYDTTGANKLSEFTYFNYGTGNTSNYFYWGEYSNAYDHGLRSMKFNPAYGQLTISGGAANIHLDAIGTGSTDLSLFKISSSGNGGSTFVGNGIFNALMTFGTADSVFLYLSAKAATTEGGTADYQHNMFRVGQNGVSCAPTWGASTAPTYPLEVNGTGFHVDTSSNTTAATYNLSDAADKNHQVTVYAAGTAYALTVTPALLAFGTTSPSLTINKAGTYLIKYRAQTTRTNGTHITAHYITFKLRRTNNTAADITNSSTTYADDPHSSSIETEGQDFQEVIYTTANTNDVIELWGSISGATGGHDVDESSIMAIRLY